jgi:hypothetical protein
VAFKEGCLSLISKAHTSTGEPLPEMRGQFKMDEFMTLRRLNLKNPSFHQILCDGALYVDDMVVGGASSIDVIPAPWEA